ncbi:hypothetical protein CXB51_003205 [Gossypium anomalum]|uniref:Reverse transcriptase Ty1/copia-type domain-containing protein n=1 Tax=Gossypium anomalum TaxID=47600 RepID=A0A8J6D781_9ROSI|nr:hypothetical protein CXB51_003205 [Gossypium anomalum]
MKQPLGMKWLMIMGCPWHPSRANSSLFYKHTNAGSVYFLIYVDDIIVTGDDSAELDVVISCLDRQFSLKDLGELSFFLGLEQKYALELLERANMMNAKPMNTLMVSSPTLTSLVVSDLSDGTLYRQVVSILQYLCLTHPDLSFAINKVSQYMHKPYDVLWTVVKRILLYVNGAIDYGLLFQASSMSLTGFSDANWASSIEDRKFIFGFFIYLGYNLVGWMSKKQSVVSRSTTEAEYRSLANATSKLMWLHSLLTKIGLKLSGTPVIWCDNSSAVSLATNPMPHARVKHVELDIHFVREKVLSDKLCVNFVPGCDLVADLLAKPLTFGAFS